MDFEMPAIDGDTTVKHILAQSPVSILMFSTLTYECARIKLDALAAAGMYFLPKNFADVSRNSSALKEKLHVRLLTLGRSGYRSGAAASLPVRTQTPRPAPAAPVAAPKPVAPAPKASTATTDNYTLKKKPKLLVIGASTGGPVAL